MQTLLRTPWVLHAGLREFCLLTLLAAWLVVTAIRQLHKPKPLWIRSIDAFGLVPTWRFFGPHPQTWDYQLFLRFRNANGAWTDWREMTPHKSRGKFSFLWNPQRRLRKVFVSACRAIAADHREDITNSRSYKLILAYVLDQPISNGNRRQFQITRSRMLSAPEDREIVFQSSEYAYTRLDSVDYELVHHEL